MCLPALTRKAGACVLRGRISGQCIEKPAGRMEISTPRRLAMRSWTFGPVVGLAAVMAFSAGGAAQQIVPAPAAQQGRQGVDQRPPSVYQKLGSDTGGPAPKRELTGVWAGPFGERVGPPMVIPPLTPLGESLRKLNVPDTGSVTVADTNDP